MPKFRFKVIDRKTTLARVGTLDAPGAEKAKEHLELQGYVVEWLRPADGAASSTTELDLEQPLLDDSRRQRYRASLADLWERVSLADQSFKLLLAIGTTLGLLLLAVGGGGEKAPPSGSKLASQSQPTRQMIALTGEVVNSNGRALSAKDVTVTLSLPQIPFRQSWHGDEALGDDQNLAQSVDFETRRVAGYAEVFIEKPGFSTIHKKQLLTSMETSIDLGKLVLEPLSNDS